MSDTPSGLREDPALDGWRTHDEFAAGSDAHPLGSVSHPDAQPM